MTDLPANAHRLKQRDFTAIPRESWVYWIGSSKCSAGVSRSPTIAIAVLHELVGYPLVEVGQTHLYFLDRINRIYRIIFN